MDFVITSEMLEAGLRGNDLLLFAYIHATGECCTTHGQLADVFGLSRQSVINIVRRLCDNGFVEVRHNAEGKNVYVSKGVKKFDTCKKNLHENVKKVYTPTSLYIDNNIYNTHTLDAHARTREDWHDEDFARRLAEGLANGGTMRDNILLALSPVCPSVSVARLQELADVFAADQRVADSNHTNDGDYRFHFTRWAKGLLKEERDREERASRRPLTAFERASLGRQQAENRFFEDLQRRLNGDNDLPIYEPINNPKQ